MAIVSRYRNGVPNWVDVGVTDVAQAIGFYTELFGWTAADQGEEAGHYVIFSIGGSSVAGLGPRPDQPGPPQWGTYLSVGDLDSALAAAEADGGQIVVSRTEVLTAGSMAMVVDPSGAQVALWQPGDHIGCERVNEPNTVVWNELATRDPGAAMPFYTAVVGWEFEPMDHADPGGYQLIRSHGRTIGGLTPIADDQWGELGSHWMVYFACDDADALAARVVELGGAVAVEPFDTPVGRVAVLDDPDGNSFAVVTLAGEPDDPDAGWID